MAFGLAAYASPGELPHTTQGSLPAVGQTLLDGLLPAGSLRKVSECLHLLPLSRALPGASRVGGGVAPAASHRSGRAQLRHPARPVADSHALRYPWPSRGQLIGVQCPRAVARPRPRDEAPPSLPRVLAARVPRLLRYYGALRFPAVLAVPLRCLRRTVTTPCACVRRSTQARRRLGARGVRVRPPPGPVVIEAETVGRPKFLGDPDCPFALFSRRRQDRGHQTATVPRRGPWYV